MSTIKVDTVRPVTADASLTLQGDSGGSGVTGITIDSSGDATFAGTGNNIGTVTAGTLGSNVNIKASINASGSAPIYACRAWVNFNGTGTVAIRESGNVSSITDNGTGKYTVNFTTAMPDTNYSVNFMGSNRIPNLGDAGSCGIVDQPGSNFTTSSFIVATKNVEATVSGSAQDLAVVNVTVFR